MSPDDPSILPWKRRDPLEHGRFNALQERTVLRVNVTGAARSMRKGNTVAIHVPERSRSNNDALYAVSILSAAALGGYYLAMVYDPDSAVAPDPNVAGVAPTSAYGTVALVGGHPSNSLWWYARTITEVGASVGEMVGRRSRWWGVDMGAVAADGVKIIEIVDGFAVNACPTGPTAGESMAGVGF